ncbi:Fido domain-containing protein [Balamuthia mandrillaris]
MKPLSAAIFQRFRPSASMIFTTLFILAVSIIAFLYVQKRVAEAEQIASQLAKEVAEARNKANDHGRELVKQAFQEAEAWRRQVVREVYAEVTDDELDAATRWKRYAQPFAPTRSCSQVPLSSELVNSLKPRAARIHTRQWTEAKQRAFLSAYIYHSTGIEGNTLTFPETALIIEGKKLFEGFSSDFITLATGESVVEVRNLLQVMHALQLSNPLQSNPSSCACGCGLLVVSGIRRLLVDVNSAVTTGTREPSMGLREHPVTVGHQKVLLPMPGEVPHLFREYVAWLQNGLLQLQNKAKTNINNNLVREALDLACDAHTRFVHIHPFTDGNGRMARLLSALVLQHVVLPPPIFSRHHRIAYMKSVSDATINGNYGPLCNMHVEAVSTSLITLEQLQTTSEALL